mmetsp:Transcript_64343/g.119605  ORF Transcript_64343/g.119605 Transcript_64343/m.119605 type:complete len:384 (-) Transcript_64343:221-1372(-)
MQMEQPAPEANHEEAAAKEGTQVSDVNNNDSDKLSVGKKLGAALMAATAGTCLVTQNGINTNLRLNVINDEPFQASLISFSIGMAAISTVAVVHRPRLGPTTMRKARWYSYMGGVLGPVYILAALLLAERLGFAAYQLCVISGQLVSALVCDSIGFLGLKKMQPSLLRIAAVICTFVGAALTASDLDLDGEAWELALYCLVSAAAGSIFPVQAAVNRSMQEHVLTPFRAVVISFAGGVIILLAICLGEIVVAGKEVTIDAGEAWMWTGGMLGATLVTCNVVAVPILGAAAFVTIFLAAQLTTAFVYDTIGAFGFDALDISMMRVAGVTLSVLASAVFNLAPNCMAILAPRVSKPGASVPKKEPRAEEVAGAAGDAEPSRAADV